MNDHSTSWEEKDSTEPTKNSPNNEKSATDDSTSDIKTDSTKNVLNDTTMKSGIYKIINTVDEKYYVGSSINVKKRINRHFDQLRKGKHHNIKLQRAYDKYGAENFKSICVEEVESDLRLTQEQLYLDVCKLNKESNYNISYVAQSPKGYRHNEFTKNKIRRSLKGRVRSKDFRVRISNGLKGKSKTPDHCRNMSISQKGRIGRPQTEEHKLMMSRIHAGKIVSDETKMRIKEAWKVRRLTPTSEETRRKMSIACNGRKHSPETKEKIRIALMGNTNGKKC